MDEEDSNRDSKRSKLDVDLTAEDSMSNASDKWLNNESSGSTSTVPKPINSIDDETDINNPKKDSTAAINNDDSGLEEGASSKLEIPQTSDAATEAADGICIDVLPKKKDDEISNLGELCELSLIFRNENSEEAAAATVTGINDPGTSENQDQQHATTNAKNGATKKRKNYRRRVLSSSSSSSSSSSDAIPIPPVSNVVDPTNRPVIFRRTRREDARLNSSSDSEAAHNSARNDGDGDSDSTSMSIAYPDFGDFDDYDDDSTSSSSNKESDTNTPHGLLESINKKPNYNWSALHQLMYREQGLSGNGRHSLVERNPFSFQNQFCAARHTVEKMKLLHKLEKHQGCVNSLNFNRSGTLLVSGSDDLKIILWKWASNKVAYAFKSGHTSNVFQTKFIDLSGGINIVSSGRDGQVRHAIIPPSGGKVISTVLLKHDGSVHKLSTTPQNPYEILTAGEDGHVVRFDVRESAPVERLVTVKMHKRKVPLYSIAHHPFDQEFCVCGKNQFVHVYDKRNPKKVLQLLYPKHLEDKKAFVSHITCAVYNSTGTEILASYSDEDIYLFNNKCYVPGCFSHRYRGHNNKKTIKGVNFFGPNSEYIVSGSDCGNFFFWDKQTESIINWIRGDRTGVVNCLEPHPSFPVLATSGLDADVKIWMPLRDEYPPPMEGLEKCIKHNSRKSVMPDHELLDDRTLFFFVHQCLRNRRGPQTDDCPYVQDLVSSSSSDGSEEENSQLRTLPCSTQ